MARRRNYGQFTPARRAALKKAQLASARKRRNRRIAIAGTVATAAVLGTAVARHKISGSNVYARTGSNRGWVTGKQLGNGLRATRTGLSTHVHYGRGNKRYSVGYYHRGLRAA